MNLLEQQDLPDIYVPTFEMRVENQKLDSSVAKNIMEISVTEYASGPSSFSLRLNDPKLALIDTKSGSSGFGVSVAKLSLGGQKSGLFTEGTRVEISLGFAGKNSRMRKMIVGEVSALTAHFPADGPATVEVQGFDLSHGLARGTVYRKFGGEEPDSALSVGQIVSQIASEMHLQPSVNLKGSDSRTLPWVQDNQTNLTFLQNLARVNGCSVWVDSGTLYFSKEPRKQPDTIKLEWGKTLLGFSPRLSTAGCVDEVVVQGWDSTQKQRFVATVRRDQRASEMSKSGNEQISKGSGGRSQLVVRDASVSSLREAEVLAEAVLKDQQVTTVTGSGSCYGEPKMRANAKVELSGLGRFSGSYFVTMVTHTISESGYTTSFEVNSGSGESVSEAPDFSGFRGERGQLGIGGVAIGLVLDNRDPEGLGRVKIVLPEASKEDVGHWARLSMPMAGAGRGMFFLPEKDDEVLVAFEQGDRARPYVLGALWNGRDKPPEANADGRNNLRLIKSRSGHVVRLDDSMGAEKIEIIDKSGSNSIAIDTSTNSITIKAMRDVIIEAPLGKISLSAKSVEVKSTADTKVEANATMDLSAKGITTIKGQLVNIN